MGGKILFQNVLCSVFVSCVLTIKSAHHQIERYELERCEFAVVDLLAFDMRDFGGARFSERVVQMADLPMLSCETRRHPMALVTRR